MAATQVRAANPGAGHDSRRRRRGRGHAASRGGSDGGEARQHLAVVAQVRAAIPRRHAAAGTAQVAGDARLHPRARRSGGTGEAGQI
jgi:hypothetical protein